MKNKNKKKIWKIYNHDQEYFAEKIIRKKCDEVHIEGGMMEYFNFQLFKDAPMKYLYIEFPDNDLRSNFRFTKELDENNENVAFDLNNIFNVLINADVNTLKIFTNNTIRDFNKLLNVLSQNNVKLPMLFTKRLARDYHYFLDECSVKFFKNEVLSLPQLQKYLVKEKISYQDEHMLENLYMFAYNIGCFSTEKLLNKNGEETNMLLGQKASSLLANLIKTKALPLDFLREIKIMQLLEKPSANLMKFLSIINQNKEFENMKLLINMSDDNGNIFSNVVNNFDKVEKLRVGINAEGLPFRRSWEDCIKIYCHTEMYEGANEENQKLVEEFIARGLSNLTFLKANKMFEYAKEKGIKEHILSVHLQEKTIMQEIEEIKKEIGLELEECKKLMKNQFERQFTYEFLSKSDPKNAIIGIYASCCANIESSSYGATIAESTIKSNDVQNIVIKNYKGEIIAKCALYVNKEYGYGVINDFEINEKYKGSEVPGESGIYDVSIKSEEEQNRQRIFNTFMRALKDFIKQYDLENPDQPIYQINVGMGFNRLKRQVKQFQSDGGLLQVPSEYGFEDAARGQRILYEKLALTKLMKKYFIEEEDNVNVK